MMDLSALEASWIHPDRRAGLEARIASNTAKAESSESMAISGPPLNDSHGKGPIKIDGLPSYRKSPWLMSKST